MSKPHPRAPIMHSVPEGLETMKRRALLQVALIDSKAPQRHTGCARCNFIYDLLETHFEVFLIKMAFNYDPDFR